MLLWGGDDMRRRDFSRLLAAQRRWPSPRARSSGDPVIGYFKAGT